jgi:hypothetical protein
MDEKLKAQLPTIQCLAAIVALLASSAMFAEMEGTYVLEADVSGSKIDDSTLKINVYEDGRHTATLSNRLGVILYTEDIDVDESDFQASFFLWESKGE